MDIHHSKNPLLPGMGVCDPHIHIFNDRAYLYAGQDSAEDSGTFSMPHWNIWSSDDLVNWHKESEISPEETFMGRSKQCWATDAACVDGKYYFYFSNGNRQTGVMRSDRPGSGFRDALGRPLLDGSECTTTEYDPTVFVDDDGCAYLIVGGPRWAYGEGAGYFMAKLAPDMISLAEPLRRVELDVDADDKSFLHKHNGKYILSWAAEYAVADSVYGPYRYAGNLGVSEDHGSFFSWHGQDFFAFTVFDPSNFHRAAGICYIHYRPDGTMAADPLIAEYGVGQYRAEWNRIYACWYMSQQNTHKSAHPQAGFIVESEADGAYISFPNIHGAKENAGLCFFANSRGGGSIEVHRDRPDGPLLGCCSITPVPFEGWQGYHTNLCRLTNPAGDLSLCLVFRTKPGESVRLRWFHLF